VADPAVLASSSASTRGWSSTLPALAGLGARPLTAAERAAGYPWRLSIYQAEFSDNVIFHRTEVLVASTRICCATTISDGRTW
jgi:hypothetical protein